MGDSNGRGVSSEEDIDWKASVLDKVAFRTFENGTDEIRKVALTVMSKLENLAEENELGGRE
ncbi:hypothetical protein BGZ65_011846, partial [Modicella reniformis]